MRAWWTAERDPMPAAMIALMAITGTVDAVSFLGLNQIFTANMTGNITLLGFSVAGAGDLSANGHLLSLAGFVTGAFVASRFIGRLHRLNRRRWLLTVTTLNATLLLGAAAIAWRMPLNGPFREQWPVITLLALAMGVRIGWFHLLHVPDLTGSVVTVTLTGLVTDSPLRGAHGVRPLRRAAAVFSMFVGAVVGATVLLNHGLGWAILVSAVAAPIVALLHGLHPGSQHPMGEPAPSAAPAAERG
jgi:uncharacterized membrane protein YoaK (UPF0700 family)